MKKIAALILISLLVVLSFDVIPHHAVVSPSHGIKTTQPLTSPPVYSISITLVNTQGVATVKNFTQLLKIDWHQYAQYLNSNISNVRFYNSTNFVSAYELYGWIQDNNTTGAVSSDVWVNLLGTIMPPYRGIIIYMAFLPVTSSWSAHWGLAAELSTPYGKFDNGANVFNFYDDFRGTTLSSAWTVPSGSDYTVNNGFTATPSAGTTTAVYNPNIQETSSIIAEWELNMSSTSYPGSNNYFQLNRYTANSNLHFLGVYGSDTLVNNANTAGITTVSILSTGTQIFGIRNDGTTVTWYYEGNSITDTSVTAVTDYLSLGWAYNGQSYNFPTIYWVRARAYPPNGVMPLVTRYGPVNATLTVPITLVNKQSTPTVVNFTQQINVDWQKYSQYADGNISNVRFYNSTTYNVYHELYAWIQNNNNPNATSSTVWVNLSNTIVPSNGYATIYMVFLNKSAQWSLFWGLAAPLEKTYGKHDNGFRVFKFYDNFKGTTLSPVWTILPNYTYSGNDIIINNSYQVEGDYVTPQPVPPPYNSNIKETSSIIVDWLLNMSTGLYNTGYNQSSAPAIELNRQNVTGAGDQYISHANSSTFWLGVRGKAVLAQNSTNLTMINVATSGDQVFGLWNDGYTVTWYYDGTAITYGGLPPVSEYLSLAWATYYDTTGDLSFSPKMYWTLARYYPPDGVMPQALLQAAPPTTVSFTEMTLPAGTTWGVTITNSSGPITQTTIGQSINFTNLFGSYTYSIIVPGGYTSDPSSGSFAVNGTTLSYPIYFALQQYAVTFTEQGLKPGTVWSITLNGLTTQANAASITYYEVNGAYQFSIGHLSYYDISPASGTVTVSNSNVNVEITFTHLWIITITETGLPPGTKWAVNYAGQIYATTTGVINLTVPEGNVYWYVVGISNYSFSPSGWQNYVGHNYTVAISFSKAPANPLSVFTEYDTFILILAVSLPISLWLIFRRRRE